MKHWKEKFKKIKGAIQIKIFNLTDSYGSDNSAEGEIMAQLKENFYRIVKKDKKVQILMALPNSWSIRKIQHKFKASNYSLESQEISG